MRAALIVAVAVVVVLAAAATRAVWAGGAALDDGDAALARGDAPEAIAQWRRAARWYVPVIGPSASAFDRLARLATTAEAKGDAATARAAWQAVRTAALAIRGATAPFDDRRVQADARLAALAADPASGANRAAGDTPAARQAWHAQVLAATARPTRGWLVLAVLGVLALISGGVVVARASSASAAGGSRRALVLCAVGLALWLAGVALA